MRAASFMHGREGFTLVEMSVVLVIISLIIGGVLVGQEMVHSAEINSVVTDVNRIKTGIANFKLKYNALPGDMMNATNYWGSASGCPAGTGGTCNGNGDGFVDNAGAWTSNSEFYRFWQHIGLAGMLPGNYTGVTASTTSIPGTIVPGSNAMPSRLGGFFGVSHFSDTLHDANNIGMWGGDPTQFPTNPAETKDIDTKIDDGRPMTGVMSNHPSFQSTCYTSTDPNTAEYLLSNQSPGCFPIFWLD